MWTRPCKRLGVALVAALAALVLAALPASAQSPVKIFGTGADGRAIPIRVATDGTLQMVLGVSGFEFEGTTVDDFETTLDALDPSADRTISLPNASGTVALLGAQTFTGHQTFAADVNIGAAGVKLTADGDGALTLLGMGDGSDENLILNLDDTANEATISSGTGVVTANFSGMDLLVNGIRVGRGPGAVASNIALGTTALAANTTGSQNIAIGGGPLNANIDGTYNVAIGYGSLFSSTDGSHNVALGPNALNSSLSADYNTAVGSGALVNITTGEYNVAVGGVAGKFITGGAVANTTSGTSVYLGAYTAASADGNANEIVLGYDAVGAGSNTAVIGNVSVANVYLGSATGVATLHAGGATFGLIATQDVIKLLPVTDNDRFTGTITIADLAGDITYTLPATGGTFAMTSAERWTRTGTELFTTNAGDSLVLGSSGTRSVLMPLGVDTLGMRNGTSPQSFWIFADYTGGSDYEYASLAATDGAFTIATNTLGAGTDNINIVLTPSGTGVVSTGANITAGSFSVGVTAGIDKTCGGPVVSATFVKGILTAMTCTS